MAALIIFFSSVLAIIFFLLGNVFNVIASGLKALGNAIITLLGLGFIVLMTLTALYLIYAIADEYIADGMAWAIFEAVLFAVILLIIFGIIGALGIPIFGGAAYFAAIVGTFIVCIAEGVAKLFEKGYAKFLNIIMNQLDKC